MMALADSAPVLRVRIYDQSGLSSSDLNGGTRELMSIYRSAGIYASVRNCPVPDSCPEEFAVNEVGVRLLSAFCRAERSRLAQAVVAKGGNLSTVYTAAVTEAAARAGVNTGRVLGYVIAHEVAHLLGLHHSGGGVMRTGWTDADYRCMGNGGILFTRAEAKAMESRIGGAVSSAASTGQALHGSR